MNIFIVASILVVAVCASVLEKQEVEFQAFKVKHGKTYLNKAEEIYRFNIFKENLLNIEKHNILYEQGLVGYKKGITQFADLTKEEFRAYLNPDISRKPTFKTTKYVKSGLTAPSSIDYRQLGQVTEVKNQGYCGSCWAFSVVGSTEAAYARKSGQLVSLSEQQLVSCTIDSLGGVNGGCNGGLLDATFPYIQEYGLESEDAFPYRGDNGTCSYSASEVVTKVSDYVSIGYKDEDALLDAVANVGPVSVSLCADPLDFYDSGIIDDNGCDTGVVDHGVLIVGYGSESGKDFWIVKNSWGPSFGEDGYFRILRGVDKCHITEDAVYPIIN